MGKKVVKYIRNLNIFPIDDYLIAVFNKQMIKRVYKENNVYGSFGQKDKRGEMKVLILSKTLNKESYDLVMKMNDEKGEMYEIKGV